MIMDGFAGRLMAGERVLWSGRPAQGLLFTPADRFLVPFSLMWCGFAVFWEATVLRQGAPWFFVLWGVPFISVGFYFVAGRFVLDALVRRGTSYAVTDRRVLIARSGLFRAFVALDPGRLPCLSLTEGTGGRGTVRFGPEGQPWGFRGGWGQARARGDGGFAALAPSLDPTPQFLAVEDARRAFDLIQRLAHPDGAARSGSWA